MNLDLPIPPLPMREAVGPTDPAAFHNPTDDPIPPHIPQAAYDSVCGCGRIARQLIQQEPRPCEYLGVDLHLPLVGWAQENFASRAPGFNFAHHDVAYEAWNPGEDKPDELHPDEVPIAVDNLRAAASEAHLREGSGGDTGA